MYAMQQLLYLIIYVYVLCLYSVMWICKRKKIEWCNLGIVLNSVLIFLGLNYNILVCEIIYNIIIITH